MWYLPHISLRRCICSRGPRLCSRLEVRLHTSTQPYKPRAPLRWPLQMLPSHRMRKSIRLRLHGLSSTYGKLPISFEVNQGQTDGSVQFLARGAGYTLFLSAGRSGALAARAACERKTGPVVLVDRAR